MENCCNGEYNKWAKRTVKKYLHVVRWLHRIYRVDQTPKSVTTRWAHNVKGVVKPKRLSGNKQCAKIKNHEKFGIKIPNTVRDALLLDRENGNHLWVESIAKEMDGLDEQQVWEFHPPDYKPGSDYQFAKLRLIFDIKQEDLRRKARLVVGGCMLDSSMWESYASVIQMMTVLLRS